MMRISTKGRYALRIMVDLAKHAGSAPVSLSSIAKREHITLKYMEGIVSLLLRNGLLVSVRGKDGGYRLAREAKDYSVYEVLSIAEGDMAPVQCLESQASECPMQGKCPTLPVWKGLEQVVREYLQSVTLADLAAQRDTLSCCNDA